MRKLLAALLMTTALAPLPALAGSFEPTVNKAAAVVKPPPRDLHEPIPSKTDPHIRTFPYDPNITLRLTSPGSTPIRVVFEAGSDPGTIAGPLVVPVSSGGGGPAADKSGPTDWAASKAGNTILLQPLHEGIPPSMLFVTTTKDSKQRNYVIELIEGTGDVTNLDDKSVYVQVTYTYPPDPDDVARAQQSYGARITEGKVRTSLTQARFSAPRSWHYSKQGADCATMTPSGWNWISDDGNQTSLLFPPHMEGASIYSRQSDDDQTETLITPIPTTTRAGTLDVLPGVYKQLVLRQGDKVCALRNDAYDPIGTAPGGGTGTISPDVIRVRKTGR